MATQDRNIENEATDEEEESEGFDLERLKLLVGFFVRSQRRHPLLGPLLFGITALFTVVAVWLWPRVYEVDFRLLAQRNFLLPALGNPNRTVPREADNPTKNMQEIVVQRDNVIALIKQVDLVDRWDASRAPILRIKDRITTALVGPTSEEDKLRAVIGLLQQKLAVTSEESALTFTVTWPSPQVAFELASIVEKNFLEARYDNEVSVIREAIRILDDRAKEQATQVDLALADLTKLQDEKKKATEGATGTSAPEPTPAPETGGTASPAPRPRPAPAVTVKSEAAQQLEDVRKKISALQASGERDLAEAQKQLAQYRMTLGPLHPNVVAQTEKVEQLSRPSPELAALKGQERTLVASIAGAAAPSSGDDDDQTSPTQRPQQARTPRSDTPAPAPKAAPPQRVDALVAALTDRDDAATTFAKAKLQAASTKYNELLTRLDAAQIELDVARAAFKYKYEVVRAPEYPKKPRKPNVPVILLGGILAAIFLAFLVPGALDLATGRLLEPWQVQASLKMPVIGILLPPGS